MLLYNMMIIIIIKSRKATFLTFLALKSYIEVVPQSILLYYVYKSQFLITARLILIISRVYPSAKAVLITARNKVRYSSKD